MPALCASGGGGADKGPACRKAIPRFTIANISPPYKEYDYFQARRRYPFQYRASAFSRVNAWWLAEAAALAYADEAYARQRLHDAGFNRIEFLDRGGTQCFIAANARFAIVVFRGSELWRRSEPFDPGRIVADLKTNIDVRLSDWPRGGRVHNGFKEALEEVWGALAPEIEALREQGLKIWLTGHSLGAALATLAADRLAHVQGLYTFGSPRVGDRDFAARFGVPTFRVVNGRDFVTHMPLEGPFRHVGERRSIDIPADSIQDKRGPAVCRGEDVPADARPHEDDRYDAAELIPAAIRDHIPLLYAILLWNELVASGLAP